MSKKIHRFFTSDFPNFDRDIVHQMREVLQLQNGERVILFDGIGREAVVILESMQAHPVGRVEEMLQNEVEPPVQITLFCAVLKREQFELVVQKAVELGVHAVVPIVTDRTIKLGVKQDRLQKIAKEAAELAGRGIIPVISDPISLNQALDRCADFGTSICFDPDVEKTFQVNQDAKTIALFVGPEGGWSEGEQELFTRVQVQKAMLGPRMLRGETAAMVGLAVVMAAIEGWG